MPPTSVSVNFKGAFVVSSLEMFPERGPLGPWEETMASFTDTFERKEVKYRLNAKQYREVLDALAGRMAADEYGRTRITSLYFDTPTRDLIARSLEKPLYKEKLRVR